MFLDEIGDMSLSLQAKLLRVIEDQVIRPVGSTKGTKVDIRFITATNKDLKAAVKQNAFREDLYYRINVISLQIPPLRERKEDIKALVQHYLEKYSTRWGEQVKEIAPEALELMMNYEWAGNVRELQNVIERAILISDGNVITPEHLPVGLSGGGIVRDAGLRQKAFHRGIHQGIHPALPGPVQRTAARGHARDHPEIALGEEEEVGDTEGAVGAARIPRELLSALIIPCHFTIRTLCENLPRISTEGDARR